MYVLAVCMSDYVCTHVPVLVNGYSCMCANTCEYIGYAGGRPNRLCMFAARHRWMYVWSGVVRCALVWPSTPANMRVCGTAAHVSNDRAVCDVCWVWYVKLVGVDSPFAR